MNPARIWWSAISAIRVWNAAGEGDGAVPLFRGERVALLLEMAAKRGDVGLGGAPRGEGGSARLEERPDLEDLPRLVDRRMGDLGAAIGLDDDQAFVRQRLKRGADDRTARAVGGADLVLGQARPWRQAMVEDGGKQAGIDGANPVAAERR